MSALVDTSAIGQWRSIVTLIAFVIANIIVLFPFNVPLYVPKLVVKLFLGSLVKLRIIPSRLRYEILDKTNHIDEPNNESESTKRKRISKHFMRFGFPFNFITAPLIADLFLLAISAIGRQEVRDGTIGADNIEPFDIMVFFITLAYIAISIDASGLIRWLAFKVLQWGGKVGHKLFFYLYAFFFVLGSFVGNDPIILSGTSFLAYMTRASENIQNPRAWIYTQFAVANIASAILVSSNPTNLVLAGAFEIKFIEYTANMIVPVVVTGVVLFPFLLYVVFADESLIPSSIKMHALPTGADTRDPVNPNIPYVRRQAEEQEDSGEGGQAVLSLEEIMNPFLDKKGATFGAVVMAATLITLLAINAASAKGTKHHVYWVTLPAAFVMFCWDVAFGWLHREETRKTAAQYREMVERAQEERRMEAAGASRQSTINAPTASSNPFRGTEIAEAITLADLTAENTPDPPGPIPKVLLSGTGSNSPVTISGSPKSPIHASNPNSKSPSPGEPSHLGSEPLSQLPGPMQLVHDESWQIGSQQEEERPTLLSYSSAAHEWLQETFPTVMAVMSHLPFALVPFAFAMFVLVQALVSTGWVELFSVGWYHWSNKTGTVGSIGGMGFISVILCNFSGTNIGTTILLSRIIQAWQKIHERNGTAISDRTFWATVYSMALGVNYGAFSTAFSASLAGLLWRDILARKHIHVKSREFARVNFPIIAISMTVGCLVLVGEIYITRDSSPYDPG
ncbi:CitMHS domain-containing protein [Fusarium keratoplasticum]|uniref:CitMHS domain-containing protein n=1 Tax=Fusarium keratoplasticum TaxID=1328300 RepID=A0ACC0R5R1_9HYPO|nr:CitMHS domain-containing protein [Fusarium keratoplasticum]KAI8675563.1 CitMHS domain-containing protein [Fusarium keratoplasticum]